MTVLRKGEQRVSLAVAGIKYWICPSISSPTLFPVIGGDCIICAVGGTHGMIKYTYDLCIVWSPVHQRELEKRTTALAWFLKYRKPGSAPITTIPFLKNCTRLYFYLPNLACGIVCRIE